jgi:hypothetical protein
VEDGAIQFRHLKAEFWRPVEQSSIGKLKKSPLSIPHHTKCLDFWGEQMKKKRQTK